MSCLPKYTLTNTQQTEQWRTECDMKNREGIKSTVLSKVNKVRLVHTGTNRPTQTLLYTHTPVHTDVLRSLVAVALVQ